MTDDNDEQEELRASRRSFLKGATLGATALTLQSGAAAAGVPQDSPAPVRRGVAPPTEAQAHADMSTPPPALAVEAPDGTPMSDYMVDVFRALGLEYVATNPGSSFDCIHESLANYGRNRAPEILTCMHEETATAMAHGYAKAAQKPMMVMVHGTVGLLHTSMAMFQAYVDRVPLLAVVGQFRDPHGILNRPHSAQDMGSLVRDFVKWDDAPATPTAFADSAARAVQIATTGPCGPTLLVLDHELQRIQLPAGRIPPIPVLPRMVYPQGDIAAIRELAERLVNAERPLIRAQRVARTSRGWDLMVEFAELLQAPVSTGTWGSWQNFPSWHPLNGAGDSDYVPDVILGLEVQDMTPSVASARKTGAYTANITAEQLAHGRNIKEFGPWAEVDLLIAADAEATLPLLIEEVRRRVSPARRRELDARGARLGEFHRSQRLRAIDDARFGWNSRPISVPRMIAELGAQIRDDDWSIVSGHNFTGDWQRRFLNFDKHSRYNGDCGGFGIGYDTPASVGAALAHRKAGRLCVGIVGDGDFNFVGPGALWTAAHHKIPLLLIVHNNRAYHVEVMVVQRMAGRRGRGADTVQVGTTLTDPDVDYAKVAQGYGVYAEGPIEDPGALAGAFRRALAHVRAGEPALVDVVSQPR